MNNSGTTRSFQTGSVRDSREGKGRYDLISPIALKRLALRMEGGASHYGERNWEKGQPLMSYLDSALRHIQNHIEGKRDEDHMGAALWNIHSFIHTEEMVKRGQLPSELDDCPTFAANEVAPLSPADDPQFEMRQCWNCGGNHFQQRRATLHKCMNCGTLQ